MKQLPKKFYATGLLLLVLVALVLTPTFSQDEGNITIAGTLDSIAADSVTVDGIVYMLAEDTALPDVSLLGQPVILSARPDAATASIIVLSISPAQNEEEPVPTDPPVETTPEVTVAPEQTAEVTPEMTAEVTVAPETTPEMTVVPEVTATPEATAEVTPSVTMTPTNDGTGDVIIVIEGPVQTINVNVVTIYNITVELAPADPILVDLVIGDILRVEGRARFSGITIIVFSVTTVNIVNVNYIFINPGVGGGIPAGCKVTKKGKIKCTRKGSGSRKSS